MSTKETFRERRSRGTTSENERRSRRLSVSSQRKRPKEREKYTQQSLRKHLFLVRFCFPAVLCTDRNSYTKERKNEVYSSLLLSSIINSSSLYIVLMNYVKSVVSASVSLGQFYRYLVRIHHGTPRRKRERLRSNSISRRRRRS